MSEGNGPRSPTPSAIFGDDRNWLVIMAALTVVEFAWLGFDWSAGIAPSPLIGTYLTLAFGGLAAALLLRLALRLELASAPWPAIVTGTLLIAVGSSAFLPLKFAIPKEIPFWLDRPLAGAERAALGSDPWMLLNRTLGWATTPIDWLYGCWLPAQLLAMFLVMLSRPSREKTKALVVYSLVWFLLGVVGAVLLSSAGPLFYDRSFGGIRFAALQETLRSRGAWVAIAESNRMWAATRSDSPGLVAGISAMPSIHVAISLWIVLTVRLMVPRLLWLAVAYFVLIWVGSVLLGWHYVSDGLAGSLGVCGIWWLTGLADRKSPAAA